MVNSISSPNLTRSTASAYPPAPAARGDGPSPPRCTAWVTGHLQVEGGDPTVGTHYTEGDSSSTGQSPSSSTGPNLSRSTDLHDTTDFIIHRREREGWGGEAKAMVDTPDRK